MHVVFAPIADNLDENVELLTLASIDERFDTLRFAVELRFS